MGLVISQYQRRAMALAGWDFQGQIDPTEGNRGKGCEEGNPGGYFSHWVQERRVFMLKLLQKLLASFKVSPTIICQLEGH